jgi:hypothetical protein
MLIPWSAFWERNYFVEGSAAFGALLTSNYTRGAVTGLGLINVWAALAELSDLLGRKPGNHPSKTDQQPEISNRQ